MNACGGRMQGAAPLQPKSPPAYADLHGRRRRLAKIHLLEREITFLQEELKSVDLLQPASRCCQELSEFVDSKPDPLIAVDQSLYKSECCCWTRIWRKPCLKPGCSCCVAGKSSRRKLKNTTHHRFDTTTRQPASCCCCWSEAVCCRCRSGNCCGSATVSCWQQESCCSCCECCRFKSCAPKCNGRVNLCPRCLDGSYCCCYC